MTCKGNLFLALMLGWSLSPVGGSSAPVWAWGNDGHQIVARIAANNLTPAARTHVGNRSER